MKESFLDVHSGKCLAKSNLFRMLTLLLFALFTTTAFAQQKNIRGTVFDASGEPLIGVNVSVKGTTIGIITDMDGKYTIKAREGEVLEFRYIGYNSVEQKVKDKSVINIAMAESNVNLDDVVVIGYGSQK